MIHNDHLGTPQKMTDASGTVVWAADYKPFGEATITVSNITNNIRFPGQYFDSETGLSYNYFRDYNPVNGRYIEKDPIGQWGGVNIFAYSNANPINRTDRTGLWGEDVHSGLNSDGYGTFTWAQQIGIPPDIARAIAIANNATDNNGNWSLIIGVPGRHFNTSMGGRDSRDIFAELDLRLAIDQYNKGNKCEAYNTLGRGLHSVQDKIAHMGWFPALPHPSWYDDASLRVDALQQTGTATRDYLLRFLGGISQ
jgi:RHS repeat-associated protein